MLSAEEAALLRKVFGIEDVKPKSEATEAGPEVVETQARRRHALQRKEPAPAGRYWVDVFGANRTSMAKWFKVFGPMGVTVRANESWKGARRPTIATGICSSTPQVRLPVVWDAVTFGYPTC